MRVVVLGGPGDRVPLGVGVLPDHCADRVGRVFWIVPQPRMSRPPHPSDALPGHTEVMPDPLRIRIERVLRGRDEVVFYYIAADDEPTRERLRTLFAGVELVDLLVRL